MIWKKKEKEKTNSKMREMVKICPGCHSFHRNLKLYPLNDFINV